MGSPSGRASRDSADGTYVALAVVGNYQNTTMNEVLSDFDSDLVGERIELLSSPSPGRENKVSTSRREELHVFISFWS